MFSYGTLDLHHRTQHRKRLAVLGMVAIVLSALIGSAPLYAQTGTITITQQIDGHDNGTAFDFVVSASPTFVEQTVTGATTQFQQSPRFAIDSLGNIYIANSGNNRIDKFDSTGALVLQWGESGTGPGQFQGVGDVAVDTSDNIYVSSGNRIQKFDSSGAFLAEWGSEGSGDGQFNGLSGIEINANGNVYVADSNNHRIQVFDTDGVYLKQWGIEGRGDGELQFPWDVATDSAGNVYVADIGNFRIQKFDANGTYLLQWGEYGTEPGLFGDGLLFLAVDTNDNIYVADPPSARIHIFDMNGNLLTHLGDYSVGDGHFEAASGIAIDNSDNVYVSSTSISDFSDPALYEILKYTSATIETTASGLASGQSQTLTNLGNGPYHITQIAQEGTVVASIECDDVRSGLNNNSIEIDLNAQATTCIFTNFLNAGYSVQLDDVRYRTDEPSSRYRITNLEDELATIMQMYGQTDAAPPFVGDYDVTLDAGDSIVVDFLSEVSKPEFEFDGFAKITSTKLIRATMLPTASFGADLLEGSTPLGVSFTAMPLGPVANYLWDFGDGNTSTVVTPTHTYDTSGVYTVTLTISDDLNESHTVSKSEYITVIDSETVVTEVSGLIAESTQWTIEGSPYLVTGPLLVDDGADLTIDPGVTVRFMSGQSIDVAGELVAIGTEEQPILFTAANSNSAAGSWGNIRFLDGSQGTIYDEAGNYYEGSILRHVEIAYAGNRSSGYDLYTVEAPDTTLLIEQSYFHDIVGGAILTGAAQSKITHNKFVNHRINDLTDEQTNNPLPSIIVNAVIETRGSEVILSHNEITDTHFVDDGNIATPPTFSAILSRGGPVLIAENRISNITVNDNSHVEIYAIKYDMDDEATIQNNQIQDNVGGGIYCSGYNNIVIKNNLLLNNSTYGINYSGYSADEISNNEITGSEIGVSMSSVGDSRIHHNMISANGTGLVIAGGTGQVYQNSITNNTVGVEIQAHESQPSLTLNSIYENAEYNLRHNGPLNGPRVNATQNWWGTTDLAAIAAGIYDWNDNSQNGIVNFEPILTDIPDPDAVPDEITEPSTEPAKPLVLIYAVLDNNLGESWTRLVNNIEAGATDGVNIRLLIDGPADNGDVYVYDIIGGNDPFCPSLLNPTCDGRYIEGTNFWNFGTEDTANPTSLYKFLTDAHAVYPNATQTIVSLIGHGSGWSANVLPGQPSVWSDQNDTLGGMLWDDHPQPGVANSNSLSTLALGSALEWATAASGKKIDLLYLDGCSMGMAEVAYELRSSTNYLLSSPNIDWASFNYNNLLPEVGTQPDARSIGLRWLELEAAELRNNPGHPFTLALIDISQMDSLASAVSTLGRSLQEALPTDKALIAEAFSAAERFDSNFDGVLDDADNYIDLADFAAELQDKFPETVHATAAAPTPPVRVAAINVKDVMDTAIVAKEFEGGVPWVYSDQVWEWESFGGLGVYLPLGVDEVRRQLFYNQTNLTWANDTQWDEFLTDFWAGTIRAANVAQMPVCRATTDGCEGLANQLPEQAGDAGSEQPQVEPHQHNHHIFMPITQR